MAKGISFILSKRLFSDQGDFETLLQTWLTINVELQGSRKKFETKNCVHPMPLSVARPCMWLYTVGGMQNTDAELHKLTLIS